MKSLDLAALLIAVQDLVEHRAVALDGLTSNVAAVYLPKIRRELAALGACVELAALGACVELAGDARRGSAAARLDDTAAEVRDRLAAVHATQDALAAVIEATLAGALADPAAPAGVRAAARMVRAELLPARLSSSKLPRRQRGAALSLRAMAPAFAAELRRVPVAGGGTLADRVDAWLAAIDAANRCESRLTDLAARTGRDGRALAVGRARLLGLVGRFQTALADELTERPDLPRDLSERLFAHFDALAPAPRARARAERPAPLPAAPARAGEAAPATQSHRAA